MSVGVTSNYQEYAKLVQDTLNLHTAWKFDCQETHPGFIHLRRKIGMGKDSNITVRIYLLREVEKLIYWHYN